MENKRFKALVVEEGSNGVYHRSIQVKSIAELPPGDMVVRVIYSSINYKDALSAIGNKGVTKNYPHTPGIDAVGIVEKCESGIFHTGDKVIVTGFDLGTKVDGGFAEYIRIPSSWAVKLPDGLEMKEAVLLGTAGLTAGLSVYNLIRTVSQEDGAVIVSGATGGVGSLSVSLLSNLGYTVAALTGKEDQTPFLLSLGAKEVLSRSLFSERTSQALLSSQWAGGIDTTGGIILENIIKSTKLFGAVTTCGNVAAAELELSVYPFILRGIRLIGISSQNTPLEERQVIWNHFASDWKISKVDELVQEINLKEVSSYIDKILAGKNVGRVIINLAS
jgi:putative YhdH/YhfP family quinone oxidoreductase